MLAAVSQESSYPLPDTTPTRLPEITPDDGSDLSPETSAKHRPGTQLAAQAPPADEGAVMVIAIYAALLPICSFILGIFGFFVGRCSRKIFHPRR